MADTQLSRKSELIPALDVLRIAGLALVTLQHCLTLLGYDAWTRVGGVLVGRLGVAILLAIAGFLAMSSLRPPLPWMGQRLRRLFPAYWLVLAVSVVLTAWSGHKQIDALQVVYQACGIGLFTPPEHMINSVTWFVTLILLCYLVVASVRLLPGQSLRTVAVMAVTAGLSGLVASGAGSQWGLRRTLAFFAAALVAMAPARTRACVAAGLSASFALSAWSVHDQFIYPALALGLLAVVVQIHQLPASIRWVRHTVDCSYEYYLVHGIALFGTIQFLALPPVIAVPAGIGLASLMAFFVRWSVVMTQQSLGWLTHSEVSSRVAKPHFEFLEIERSTSLPRSEWDEDSVDELELSASR